MSDEATTKPAPTQAGDACLAELDGEAQFEQVVLPAERKAIDERRATTKRVGEDLVGLALSGGGIRSASFSLGVIQALDSRQCIPRIDYLSSVSGGGYAGCCLTSCMTKTGGKVPFNKEDTSFGDTDAVQHVRDFSNYLMPRGYSDLVTSFGLIGRGWAANIILIAPLFFLSTLILLWARPTVDSLAGWGPVQRFVERAERDHHVPIIPGFPDTTFLLGVLALVLGLWALVRSVRGWSAQHKELSGRFVFLFKAMLWLVAIFAWLELQPLVLAAVEISLHPHPNDTIDASNSFVSRAAGKWFTGVTPYIAPLGAAVAFMARNLLRVTKTRKGSRVASGLKRLGAKTLLLGAAVILPSAIWYCYLRLTLAMMPAGSWGYATLLVLFGIFSVIALFIDPNATSLHRLYRDRLSKAFLFDPDPRHRDGDGDLAEFAPKLHEIDTARCPYPIVNAALNLEGSAFANRRGRNAEFFEFTPRFIGSDATMRIGSKTMADKERSLDLGTAMAISGAAFSPNMGSATIKPLVPTLALLNLRLGFWMRNPKRASDKPSFWERHCFLLWREIFSGLDEDSPRIYVTDGGNIENLGIHALLKRRCKLVIAVDAEADPSMTFAAYLKLQRYARIDFGVLLDLPWQPIRDRALALNAAIADDQTTPAPMSPGRHVAVGRIRYDLDAANDGVLIYVKASLTGDESDYILDYKTRNPDFPHETTGDQFFGEEQLEVYRALGFHVMSYFLDRRSPYEVATRGNESVGDARRRIDQIVETVLNPKTPKGPSP